MASGQGSHWLTESPTIFHLCTGVVDTSSWSCVGVEVIHIDADSVNQQLTWCACYIQIGFTSQCVKQLIKHSTVKSCYVVVFAVSGCKATTLNTNVTTTATVSDKRTHRTPSTVSTPTSMCTLPNKSSTR